MGAHGFAILDQTAAKFPSVYPFSPCMAWLRRLSGRAAGRRGKQSGGRATSALE